MKICFVKNCNFFIFEICITFCLDLVPAISIRYKNGSDSVGLERQRVSYTQGLRTARCNVYIKTKKSNFAGPKSMGVISDGMWTTFLYPLVVIYGTLK